MFQNISQSQKKNKELKIECLLSEDILKMRVLKYLSIAIVNEREEQLKMIH